MSLTIDTTDMTVVIAFRHGDKDGDCLTPIGRAQIAYMLARMQMRFGPAKVLAHSKTVRTTQCANIGESVSGSSRVAAWLNLGFMDTFKACDLQGDLEAFKTEMAAIIEAGDTMVEALKMSDYTRQGRQLMSSLITEIAARVSFGGVVWCFSHGPWAQFAVPEHKLAETPYDIGVATAVVHWVDDEGNVVDSEVVPCDLK